MLNILEGYDIAELGFGTVDDAPSARRGAEDRLRRPRRGERRSRLRQGAGRAHHLQGLCRRAPRRHRSRPRAALDRRPAARKEGADTTHLTVADGQGNVVTTTQTINSLFGARFIVPGTGMVPNDYMSNFDPRPGNALSIAPGKRVTTSMSPMMALRDGRVVYALGLPGGRKIFPVGVPGAGQPDRPRHGAAGGGRGAARLDRRARARGRARHSRKRRARACKRRGHTLQVMPTVAGGMNAIQFHDGRQHDRRRLLARRRLAGRPGRRAGAPRRALRVAAMIDATR